MTSSHSELPVAQRTIVPLRHWGRWIAAVVVLFFLVSGLIMAAVNPLFGWGTVGHYLFQSVILKGLLNSIGLSAAAMAIGVGLGIVIAVCRLSANPVLSTLAAGYSWLFRGVPGIVQLLFWFFLAAVVPTISLGIPFGPQWVTFNSNDLIGPFTAAMLGLGLNEAAYMGEIIRGGILSIPAGQTEASKALGMTGPQILWRTVLPQTLRVVVPPTGNEVISMLKYSSIVIVIGYAELMTTVSVIYARNYETISMLIVAAIWYLVITALLSIGQMFLERRLGRGFQRSNIPKVRRVRDLKAPTATPTS